MEAIPFCQNPCCEIKYLPFEVLMGLFAVICTRRFPFVEIP